MREGKVSNEVVTMEEEWVEKRQTHSAKAVYICWCSLSAVGVVWRKGSFRRGLATVRYAMRL